MFFWPSAMMSKDCTIGAPSHHGGDLAAEGDVTGAACAGGTEEVWSAPARLRVHTLAAQFGLDQRGVLRRMSLMLAALVSINPVVVSC